MPTGEQESAGRVLIIDDEADFADYLRNVAVLEGYEAHLVRTMAEFAEALDRVDPTNAETFAAAAVGALLAVLLICEVFTRVRFSTSVGSPAESRQE